MRSITRNFLYNKVFQLVQLLQKRNKVFHKLDLSWVIGLINQIVGLLHLIITGVLMNYLVGKFANYIIDGIIVGKLLLKVLIVVFSSFPLQWSFIHRTARSTPPTLHTGSRRRYTCRPWISTLNFSGGLWAMYQNWL